MNPIEYLLQKYRNLVPPDMYVKEAAIDVIFKKTGLHLDKKTLSLRGGILHLKIDPIVKSEVLQSKSEIMRELTERLDRKSPKDLR